MEDAIVTFNEAKDGVCSKAYDYLDQRNTEFNADFDIFMDTTTTLKESIATLIEDNFASVWETPQGIKFLTRFEKVSYLKSSQPFLFLKKTPYKGQRKNTFKSYGRKIRQSFKIL